jgi:hypothetical protein
MGSAESITITNKNCKHMNLVKLQKNKVDNTLVLDIITAENQKSDPTYQFEFNKQFDKDLSKFSFFHQMSDSTSDIPKQAEIIHAIRFFSIIWVVLLHTCTALSFASSEL